MNYFYLVIIPSKLHSNIIFLDSAALIISIIGAVVCMKTSTHHTGTTKWNAGYRTLYKEEEEEEEE